MFGSSVAILVSIEDMINVVGLSTIVVVSCVITTVVLVSLWLLVSVVSYDVDVWSVMPNVVSSFSVLELSIVVVVVKWLVNDVLMFGSSVAILVSIEDMINVVGLSTIVVVSCVITTVVLVSLWLLVSVVSYDVDVWSVMPNVVSSFSVLELSIVVVVVKWFVNDVLMFDSSVAVLVLMEDMMGDEKSSTIVVVCSVAGDDVNDWCVISSVLSSFSVLGSAVVK